MVAIRGPVAGGPARVTGTVLYLQGVRDERRLVRMTGFPLLERRAIPGTSANASLLGISLDPPPVASPAVDRATVTALRRARERGVTTYDLAHRGSLVRAERLIAAAFPDPDPSLLFIVGRSWSLPLSYRRPVGERPAAPSDPVRELEGSLAEDARRIGRHGSVLVDFDSGEASPERIREAASVLDRHRTEGRIAGWSFHRRSGADHALPDATATPRALCVELSLLDRSALGPLVERASRGPLGVLVRDPFAGGRLDGSRFAATMAERGPSAAPLDVRSLHAEFDPVLRLGFLTRGHRRTLAQAGLLFLFRWPWVSTVLVPLPRPERWEEILGATSAPPLDAAELQALEGPGVNTGAAGVPGSRTS
jgi:aryl-alcohol dehydrogenase-like predicted oxidoreductase